MGERGLAGGVYLQGLLGWLQCWGKTSLRQIKHNLYQNMSFKPKAGWVCSIYFCIDWPLTLLPCPTLFSLEPVFPVNKEETTKINIVLWSFGKPPKAIWLWFKQTGKWEGKRQRKDLDIHPWSNKIPKCQKVAKTLTLFSDSSTVDLSDILSCLWKLERCCYYWEKILQELYAHSVNISAMTFPCITFKMTKG